MKKTIPLNLALLLVMGAAANADLRKGPYLIYPGSNTEMMVLWQLHDSRACTLEWGLDTSYSDGNTVTAEYGADHQHKYTITGLTPGSKYQYRVTVAAEQYTGSFRAAPPEMARQIKLLAYGDTRANGSIFDHDRVDGAMVAALTADSNYQTFTMLTGDWVDDGETEEDWDNEFFNRACANSLELQANLPINGCIGNHEWEDGDTPPTYFDKYWPYPYVDGFYWSFDYGPVHIAVIDQYKEDYGEGSEQLVWLEADLATTDKEWKILQFHEPGYSAGGGHDDDGTVQEYIQPLCERYAVDMVVCGHNHYYARCDKNGVKHITAGGGGAPLRPPNPSYSPYIETCTEAFHFCKIDVRGNELAFEAVTPEGTIIDEFTLQHPPVNLLGPADGATVGAHGAVLSCEAVPGAVSYQLLFGPAPDEMMYLVSETYAPPTEVITTFPFEQTWWTVKVRTRNHRNLYAMPICIHTENVRAQTVENLNSGKTYCRIQDAIDDADPGDEIVLGRGPWQYFQDIDFKGKNLTLRSTDPNSRAVIVGTVIHGGNKDCVTFSGGEGESCALTGLTITGGNTGIYCTNASPTICKCRIVRNKGAGLGLFGASDTGSATVTSCAIVGNGGIGVEASGQSHHPMFWNCTIAGNKRGGINSWDMCSPILTNSIVWGNVGGAIVGSVWAGFSDVEGGWLGIENIDVDPCFVSPGYWIDTDDGSIIVDLNDPNAVWIPGDYHLLPGSTCINAGYPDYPSAPNETDLDGRPRVIDGRIDMGAYEFVPPIEVVMKFTPQALNPGSKGRWVKAHFVLPEGFTIEDVDINNPARLIEPFRVQSQYINVYVKEEDVVEIKAAFDRDAFSPCGSGQAEQTLTIVGLLSSTSGQYFRGTDTIKIINKTLEQLAGFASHWLESACDEPDWCSGFDIDQDSVVNFADFVTLNGCYFEIAAP